MALVPNAITTAVVATNSAVAMPRPPTRARNVVDRTTARPPSTAPIAAPASKVTLINGSVLAVSSGKSARIPTSPTAIHT